MSDEHDKIEELYSDSGSESEAESDANSVIFKEDEKSIQEEDADDGEDEKK
jgi:hypothetical protein